MSSMACGFHDVASRVGVGAKQKGDVRTFGREQLHDRTADAPAAARYQYAFAGYPCIQRRFPHFGQPDIEFDSRRAFLIDSLMRTVSQSSAGAQKLAALAC